VFSTVRLPPITTALRGLVDAYFGVPKPDVEDPVGVARQALSSAMFDFIDEARKDLGGNR
jgi:hypothetical protein